MKEKETIPVEKAIHIGVVWMVIVPLCMIPLGFFILVYLLGNHIIGEELAIGSLFGIIALPFIYRAAGFTIWRVWAFGRVRNVHELRRKALNEHVMFRKNSLMERLEIKLPHQRRRLQEIEKKFKFLDDTNYSDLYAPVYTISLSMRQAIGRCWFLLFLLPTLANGLIYGRYDIYFKIFAIFLLVSLAFLLFKFTRRGMVLELSEEGINSRKYGFVPWENLFGEYIHTHMGTFTTNFYEYHVLVYYNRGYGREIYKRRRFKKRGQATPEPVVSENRDSERHEVDLDYTGVDMEEITKLLALYRRRHSEQANGRK